MFEICEIFEGSWPLQLPAERFSWEAFESSRTETSVKAAAGILPRRLAGFLLGIELLPVVRLGYASCTLCEGGSVPRLQRIDAPRCMADTPSPQLCFTRVLQPKKTVKPRSTQNQIILKVNNVRKAGSNCSQQTKQATESFQAEATTTFNLRYRAWVGDDHSPRSKHL